MISLYIATMCIYMFYIHSLLVYPIQGTFIKDISRGSAHTRQHEIEAHSAILSRISHLSNIYFELAKTRRQYFLHDPSVSTNSRYDVSTLRKAGFNGDDNSFQTENADTPQTTDFPGETVNSWRPKREQGWYVQYGKRNHRTLYSTHNHRTLISSQFKDNARNTGLMNFVGVPSKVPFASAVSPLDSKGKLALAKSALLKYSELLQALDGLTPRNDISLKKFFKYDVDDADSRANSVSDRLQPPSKRQQGWFISYGKRSDRHQRLRYT